MRLMDCFTEAVARTVEYVDAIEKGDHPPFDEVSLSVRRAVSEHARDYLEGEYSERQYETAKFAAAAFIDEAFLSSSWEHKRAWKNEMLQKEYFQTVTAGEGFYERLNALSPLNPAERDIREVYYYCLMLGFRGKYFDPDDQTQLERLKQDNLHLLADGLDVPENLETARLFPEGYPPGGEGEGVRFKRSYRSFFYAIPPAVVIILFFVFKTRIIAAANYLVTVI